MISATDVLSVHREALALRGAAPGRYSIELVRSAGGSGPVRGTVSLRIGKSEQTTPFELDADRTRVATVTLRNEAKLVPLQRWD